MMEERANVLARETGCIERQRKFSGADLIPACHSGGDDQRRGGGGSGSASGVGGPI